ncbi:hypothetical protein HDU88_008875 [Geranomyces variabilis]|nr:hypothetical protein HDU88_008875 [Geranomyces variabilis]
MADHSELYKYQPAPGWHQHLPRTLSPSPPLGASNHHYHHHQLHPPHDSGPSALYGGASNPFSSPAPLARPAPVYRGYGAASGPTTMQPHGISFGVQMQAGTSLLHNHHHHRHHDHRQGPVLGPLGSASPASQHSALMYMPERHYMMYSPSHPGHGGGSGVMGYQPSSSHNNMTRPAPSTMTPQQHQLSDRHYADDHEYYMRVKRSSPESQAPVDDSDSLPRRSTRPHTRAAPNHHRNLPPNVAPYVPANRSSGSPSQHLALATAVTNTGESSSTINLAARDADSPAAAERQCRDEGADYQSSPSRRPSSAAANNATSPATAAGAAAAAGKNAKAAGAKRPANSWILYRQEKHPIVLAQNEGITNNEISKVVAEWWRNEPEDVKNVYKSRAEEERRRHRILHPDYKYAPRKNKIRRKRKRKINKALDNHESGAESADDDNRRYITQQHPHQYQLPQQQQQLLHNQYLAQYRSLQQSNHFQSPQPHSHYGIHPPPPPQLLPPAPSIARATSGDRWYSRSSLDEPFFDSTAPASSSRRYSADSSSSLRYQYAESDYSLAMPSRRASQAGYYPVAADGRPNGHRMSVDRMSIGYAPVAPAPATTEYVYAPRHRPKENEFTFEALGFARCVDDTDDALGSDVDTSTDSVYAPDDGLSRAMMMQLAD